MHLTAVAIGFAFSLTMSGIVGFVIYLTNRYRKNHEHLGYPKEYYIRQAVQEMISNDQNTHRGKPTRDFFGMEYPISFYDEEAFLLEYQDALRNEIEKKKYIRQIEDISTETEKYRETRQEARKQIAELGEQ